MPSFSRSPDEQAASNALLFLASLYNVGALHCKLLYELIEELVRRFGEIELSLLCLLLRSVGPQLRTDDPAALRRDPIPTLGPRFLAPISDLGLSLSPLSPPPCR